MRLLNRQLITRIVRCACSAASVAVLIACSGSSTPYVATAASSEEPAAPVLVGAWESRIQFTSGPYVPIKDMRFLYVFNAGGTMTESSNYDAAPPVTPAYGVWRQSGPGKFEAKYVFYPTKAPAAFKDLEGGWLPTGQGVLTEHITVAADGASFESTLTFESLDMFGKPAPGGGTATAHGSRISF